MGTFIGTRTLIRGEFRVSYMENCVSAEIGYIYPIWRPSFKIGFVVYATKPFKLFPVFELLSHGLYPITNFTV